jgi:hypothetical protein
MKGIGGLKSGLTPSFTILATKDIKILVVKKNKVVYKHHLLVLKVNSLCPMAEPKILPDLEVDVKENCERRIYPLSWGLSGDREI